MSYSFHFTQFPAKDYSELWDAFTTATFSSLVEKKIIQIEAEREKVAKREVDTLATFWSNREAWMACQDKFGRLRGLEEDKAEWEALHKQMTALEQTFQQATSKKSAETIAKAVVEVLQNLQRKLIPECSSYGESARDLDYRFLVQLFQHVAGEDLDSLKAMPTLEAWFRFYQGLKPDVVNEQFSMFFRSEDIAPQEQEEAKKYCFQLLHGIKGMIKMCRERGWDLLFVSEFGKYTMDERWIKAWWKEKITSSLVHRFPV